MRPTSSAPYAGRYVSNNMKYHRFNDYAVENVDGPFYTIDIGSDCGCLLPEAEAPTLLKTTNDPRDQTYFYRQPETKEEIENAIEAINICPIHDIRYGGRDPEIIKLIEPSQTDYKILKNGKLKLKLISTRYDT
ncbi:MAG: ferredoxin [Pseudomonadales bacterium]|nr:ferredoxin [Pseudomonadales bacterium]